MRGVEWEVCLSVGGSRRGGAVGVIERIPLGLGAGFILLRRGNLSLSSDTRVAVVYLVYGNGNIQYLGVHCQYKESAESTLKISTPVLIFRVA